jgi:hypothetical protein
MEIGGFFLVRGDTLILMPLTVHIVLYTMDILISGGIFTKKASLEGDISGWRFDSEAKTMAKIK